ncbi:thermonuclease family protein, partial [bacterium]
IMKYLKHLILFILIFICAVSISFAYKKIKIHKFWLRFGDGDTIIYRGETIRILGIDTPEVKNVNYGIMKDQYLGKEASLFTKKSLKKAKNIYYIPYKKDRYGRTLAHVIVDGKLLAVKLIKAGLAYETISVYGDSGFPEFAALIKKAADETAKPNFENPIYWKRKHQRKRR